MTFKSAKYCFIVLAICFSHFNSSAQQSKIDSLQKLLQAATHDTTRLRLYLVLGKECEIKDNLKYAEPAIQLADKLLSKATNDKERKIILKQKANAFTFYSVFYEYNVDTAKMVEVWRKQLTIYKEIKDTVNIINAMGLFSNYYSESGNMPLALEFCQAALTLAQQSNYKKGIAAAWGRMGNIYKEQNDNVAALQFFKKRLSMLYQLKDTTQLLHALPQTGRLYSDMHDTANALKCFNESIALCVAAKKDKRELRYLYNCIGEMHEDNKNYPRALEMYYKTIAMAEEWGDKDWSAHKYGRIGTVYRLQGDIQKALEFQHRSLQLMEDFKFNNVVWANLDLAVTYKQQKNYKKAKFYCERAYTILKKGFYVRSISDVERLASQIDSALGNYKEAYYHYQQYIFLRDKLNSEEVRKAAVKEKYQNEYDTKKIIDKAEQDKKDLLTKEELQKQKVVRNSFIGGFVLVLILALIVFRSYRQKQRSNKELAEKNIEIEEKNKDILDSIRYAKRIQSSLLPTEKYIERIINKKDRV